MIKRCVCDVGQGRVHLKVQAIRAVLKEHVKVDSSKVFVEVGREEEADWDKT